MFKNIATMSQQLTWSNYVELLKFSDINKINYYIDRHVKMINQDRTIGIIICKKDNNFVMEYVSDDRIFRAIHKINS